MKRILQSIIIFLICFSGYSQEPFITTWKTNNPGTSDTNQVTIPTTGSGYDYIVDWGDGAADTSVTGSITHTYSDTGIYTISIKGDFPRIYFAGTGDKDKILTVEQWGDISWKSMLLAFNGCSNLTIPATDAPDLSAVNDMSSMFNGCTSFNQPIGHWDVGNIKYMSGLFNKATNFNQSIENWDVSNVIFMNSMFFDADSFNQPLDNWVVSNVTNMNRMFVDAKSFDQPLSSWDMDSVQDIGEMFRGASSFNQPIGSWDIKSAGSLDNMFSGATSFNQPLNNWDVSNITNMKRMFLNASTFNQPLDKWDVSNVTNMSYMFSGANAFNQPLDGWNVGSATNMSGMFNGAKAFNQSLESWDVSKVTTMEQMFHYAYAFNKSLDNWDVGNVKKMEYMLSSSGLSISNYDSTLAGWAALPTLQDSVTLGAEGLNYCFHGDAHQKLIDDYDWVIIGDAHSCQKGPALHEVLQRSGSVAFSYGNDAFIGLGVNENGYLADFYKYNVTTRLIEKAADFPGVARSEAVAFIIDNKAYVGTGIDENGDRLNDFYCYNIEQDSWAQLNNFGGEARSAAVAFEIDGIGYVGTGMGTSEELGDFWKYETLTDTWTETPAFSGDARQEAVAFVVNNKAYVSGGVQFSGGTYVINDVQEFDPAENKWTEKIFADINLSFYGATAFTLKGKAFIAYGNQDYVVRYDPQSGDIMNLGDEFSLDDGTIGPVRSDAISFIVADTAYFGLGYSGFVPTIYHSSIYKFVLENSAPTYIQLSPVSVNENEPAGTLVGTFFTGDSDANDTHTLELVAGDGTNDADNELFYISNDSLFTAVELDHEEGLRRYIYVRTTDSFDEYFEEDFYININNVNEAPVASDTAYTFSKDTYNGYIIGKLIATDPDQDGLSYTIVSGNTNNAFSISSSGYISIVDITVLNDAEPATFNLSVDVSDGGLTANITVSLTAHGTSGIRMNEHNFELFPNPVNDVLKISHKGYPAKEISIEIIDITGQTVFSGKMDKTLDVSGLRPGIYFVRIKSSNQAGVVKFIKR